MIRAIGVVLRALLVGRVRLVVLAGVLAVAVFAFAVVSDGFGDAPLFLLAIPLALSAIAYGLRGALAMALVGSVLATVWWFEKGQPDGAVWLASRVGAYLLVGAALGWFVDSRERVERRLAHHNALSLDLIATANFDGYFTCVNPAFTKTLGFTSEEMMAEPFLAFVHPDDRESTVVARVEQTAAGNAVINFQNRYRCKDGSYKWLEWTSRPDPKTKELIAVARDVTERKCLEERDREHTRLLEEAVRERTRELQQRNADLEEARTEMLWRLALAAEYRDDDTHEHTQRVGRAAALLAAALGLSDRDVALIREAAPLHDVGKLGVSDTVLLKPGKLTRSEFEHVKQHAKQGGAILSGSRSDVLQMAEEIALTHHEWWNGNGYPLGLKGNAIPLTGRIVAIVDVFDALTHRRPYKPAWSVEDALAEIRHLRGVQFDPMIVDAFERLDHHELVGASPLEHVHHQRGRVA